MNDSINISLFPLLHSLYHVTKHNQNGPNKYRWITCYVQPHEIPGFYSECHIFYLLLFLPQLCVYKEKTSQRHQKEIIECIVHEKKGGVPFLLPTSCYVQSLKYVFFHISY